MKAVLRYARSTTHRRLALVAMLSAGCSVGDASSDQPSPPDLSTAEVISQHTSRAPDGTQTTEVVMQDGDRQEWTLTLRANEDADAVVRTVASRASDIEFSESASQSTGVTTRRLRHGDAMWEETAGLYAAEISPSMEEWYQTAITMTARVDPAGAGADVAYGDWWCETAVRIGCYWFQAGMHGTACFGICAPALFGGPPALITCTEVCMVVAEIVTTGRESIGDQCFASALRDRCGSDSSDGGGSGGGDDGGGDTPECQQGGTCHSAQDCGLVGLCNAANECECPLL